MGKVIGHSPRRQFDLLVLGSGISGISSAVAAAEKGLHVALVTKETSMFESNTWYAQGGIVGESKQDNPHLLEEDIIQAGAHINNIETVRLLVNEGPKLVNDFLTEKVHVPFSRTAEGAIDLTREAAHSVRRIYHVTDKTGQAIQTALVEYLKGVENVSIFESHTAVDLITNTHNSDNPQDSYRRTAVVGAYVLDGIAGKVSVFLAPSVILSTGGVGNLFLQTSNPPGATGDGIAMAYRIGAEVMNAEYVQFHPTVLYHPEVKRFLITESLRGEGARLMNRKGEYFMERYSPKQLDLAPRDEVARAIYREMQEEDSDFVRLDARGITGISLDERFPGIFGKCMGIGIDIRKEPIPVVPAAHFFCGGIKVSHDGESSIDGLYAVGEAACTGVHGANRLASISLLEGLYWGVRTGKVVAERRASLDAELAKNIRDWQDPRSVEEFDPVLVNQDFRTIQSTMWHYAGIIRSRNRLLRAQADLNYLSHRIEQFYKSARLARKIIELRNSVLTAGIIVKSALSNPVSKGCHYIE
jgi:L-aspartate oxidase